MKMNKHSRLWLVVLCLLMPIDLLSAGTIHRLPDFRNSYWGDTMEEVIKAEGKDPYYTAGYDCDFKLDENPYFNEIQFYLGENNSLFGAGYTILFDTPSDYPESTEEYETKMADYYRKKNSDRVLTIKSRLIAKYGKGEDPNYEEIIGLTDSPDTVPPIEYWADVDTYWVTERTIISLYVPESLGFAYLNYLSRTPKADAGRSNAVYLDALI